MEMETETEKEMEMEWCYGSGEGDEARRDKQFLLVLGVKVRRLGVVAGLLRRCS